MHSKSITALILLSLSSLSFAAVEEPNNTAKNIEVIEVIDKFTKPQLEKIALQAKLDMYETFNTYNTVREYRVICEPTAKIGSQIKRQHCEPVYYTNKFAEMSAAFMLGSPKLAPTQSQVLFAVKQKKKQADSHLLVLANKHPDLKLKLERYAKAKATIELAPL